MEVEWKLLEEELPPCTGFYPVLWSEPYSESMSLRGAYYNGVTKRFHDSPAGANEILYWLDGLDEFPDEGREGRRTRLLKETSDDT